MIKKGIIVLNIVAIIFLDIAIVSNDHQMQNYAGAVFLVFTFLFFLRMLLCFLLGGSLHDDFAYRLAGKILDFERTKSKQYEAVMRFIIPTTAFIGLCILYPGLYISGLYVLSVVCVYVSTRYLKRMYSYYE